MYILVYFNHLNLSYWSQTLPDDNLDLYYHFFYHRLLSQIIIGFFGLRYIFSDRGSYYNISTSTNVKSFHRKAQEVIKCMLAWLRNVNIAILASHVSWNVLTSSTLAVQPCICTITLNGHARISNLHCQFLCCCALLQVEISLKNFSQNAT